MDDKLRKLITKLGIFLIFVMVASFFLLAFLGVLNGQGAVPIIPNPTAKGGSAFPIAAIVFGATLVIVLLYGLILRVLNWLSQKHGPKFQARKSNKATKH